MTKRNSGNLGFKRWSGVAAMTGALALSGTIHSSHRIITIEQQAEASVGSELPVITQPIGESIESQAHRMVDAIANTETTGRNYASGNNYGTSASGFMQWIDSTWNGYGGYSRAKYAPPEVQERRAFEDVMAKWETYGDWRNVAMAWFLPKAVGNPKIANRIPKYNVITPNQYADKVMRRFTESAPK